MRHNIDYATLTWVALCRLMYWCYTSSLTQCDSHCEEHLHPHPHENLNSIMQENIVVPYAIRHLGFKQIMIFKKNKKLNLAIQMRSMKIMPSSKNIWQWMMIYHCIPNNVHENKYLIKREVLCHFLLLSSHLSCTQLVGTPLHPTT